MERRCKMLHISRLIFPKLFGAGEKHYVVTNAIPDDAVVVDIHWSHITDFFEVKLHSVSFEIVQKGMQMPNLPPVIVSTVAASVS